MENELKESGEDKTPITIYLQKGEAIRIESVSDDPEHILLRADAESGEIKSSRKLENFPIEIQDRRPDPETATTTGRSPLLSWGNWDIGDPQTLFILSLVIYLFVRVFRLAEFPIFFFSDEAMPVIRAQEFLTNGFRSKEGILFPTFFKNTFQFSLSTTVYMQALGYLFFGKSVFVARLLAVLSTIPAAIGMGYIFKTVFPSKYWFVGTLLFSIVPAWFLHSRTAFEVVTAVAFYAVFVYFYFSYRETADFRKLAIALTSGALCFYSYNPGRVVMVLSGLLLFLSDAKFHWDQRSNSIKGLGVLVLLVIPYLRHQWLYPQSVSEHLFGLGSYWVREIPTSEKLGIYLQEYRRGLSPAYWYLPEQHEWVRHHMKGYGHLSRYFAPFALWGLVLCILNFRDSKYRNLILLLVAAPAGSALAELFITRAMFFVVPATLITALGLLDLLDRLWHSDRFQGWLSGRLSHPNYTLAIFVLFALFNISMMRDAVVNGPTWYDNYSLGGLQYGARQVFGKAEELLDGRPDRQLYISNTWTNGTNTVGLFFFDDPLPFRLVDLPRDNLKKKFPMPDDTMFILSREDYDSMLASNKFTNIQVSETIKWPNGRDGFYVLTADYVPNIDELFAAELAELRRPKEIRLSVSGFPATVFYPALDLGQIEHIFDANILTLGRTYEGNPANFKIVFDEDATAAGLTFDVRDRAADISATVQTTDGQVIDGFGSYNGQTGESAGAIVFDEPLTIKQIDLIVNDPQQGPQGHVHLWEIGLLTDN